MAALTWLMKLNFWVKILLSLAVITGPGFWRRRGGAADVDCLFAVAEEVEAGGRSEVSGCGDCAPVPVSVAGLGGAQERCGMV